MKALMLKLEPIIWLLFGAGMMVGGFVLPAFIATVGLGLVGGGEPRRAPDLIAGAVEVGPDVHQALRIPMIMLTALFTITRSPASRSSGTLSGPRRAVSSIRSG